MKVHITPFCDGDYKHSLQVFAGINLILCTVSIFVNLLLIFEISYFYNDWKHEQFKVAEQLADMMLFLDVGIIVLQLFYGVQLYNVVLTLSGTNATDKIRKWRYPVTILVTLRIGILAFSLVCVPISAYYLYFTLMALAFSVFLFWPIQRYLTDFATTESTRLLWSYGGFHNDD